MPSRRVLWANTSHGTSIAKTQRVDFMILKSIIIPSSQPFQSIVQHDQTNHPGLELRLRIKSKRRIRNPPMRRRNHFLQLRGVDSTCGVNSVFLFRTGLSEPTGISRQGKEGLPGLSEPIASLPDSPTN